MDAPPRLCLHVVVMRLFWVTMMQTVEIAEMRPVVPEWYNDVYATHKLGFVWMAFDGLPTSDHPRYHDEDVRRDGMRVRQLMSPEQLADERWKSFLESSNAAPANGTEPLAYTYCSSGCTAAIVPDLVNAELATKLSRLVHEECDDVANGIGPKLAQIVRNHFATALDD